MPEQVERLKRLADLLEQSGLTAEQKINSNNRAYLIVKNPKQSYLREIVGCHPHPLTGNSRIWFFHEWGDPMCEARDPARACEILNRVLAARMAGPN